jgi:hypothetical protein
MPLLSSSARLRLALGLLALALAPLALFASRPSEAEARVVWCAGDPAIVVNGNVVSVTVHLPLDRLRDVDYVEVVFHVPGDASVTALINDSLLFEARTSYVRDLPRQGRRGLLSGTPVTAEIIVHHRGATVDVAATTIAIGRGTRLWQQGTSDEPLRVETRGALNLPLLNWGIRIR